MHRFFMGLSTAMAWLGGAMLTLLVLLTCLSVTGRETNELLHGDFFDGMRIALWLLDEVGVGAISGDFELLEAGMAFTIFAFLPLTQMTAGHASVDLVANALPARFNRLFQVVVDIVFAAVLVLIAVQIWDGMASKMRAGETTLRLQFPIWWSYALATSGAIIAAVVGVYVALIRIFETFTDNRTLPTHGEADH